MSSSAWKRDGPAEPAYRDSTDSDGITKSSSSIEASEGRSGSTERQHYDKQLLDEEDEVGELLARRAPGNSSRAGQSLSVRKPRTKSRRKAQRGRAGKELMYELEEGDTNRRTSSSSSISSNDSSERDREKIGAVQARHSRRQSLLKRICKYGFLNIIVAVVFVAIAYGAYRATWDDDHVEPSLLSNGTSMFAPTTILVSLDGFRADYLQRGITPALLSLIDQGVSPKHMLPSFPSVTFPNHHTMVTGLFPESHGIVGNHFWDPHLKEEFYYSHKSAMHPKWWGGEPLWVAAEKQRVRTATHMWPGSEAHISHIEPSFVDKFNGDENLLVKANRILELLDKPGPRDEHPDQIVRDQRPQLILAYVPDVDSAGHQHGPNSTEITEAIGAVDQMIKELLKGLNQRNLTEVVNLIVVSDHGMATTSVERTIQLEDLVNLKYFEHIDGWPNFGLRPTDPDLLEMLYDHLVKEANTRDGFDVYLKDNMPKRYHFSQNDRIAPLWVMPHTGWAIVTAEDFNVTEALTTGEEYHPRGIHGYDHEDPLMRSIFVARGPAFPHPGGSEVNSFQNVELYNILCDSVGVKPSKNNGTLRLPFQVVGTHSMKEYVSSKPPSDPPTSTKKSDNADSTAVSEPTTSLNVTRPTVEKVNGTQPDLSDPSTWPDWFGDKFDKLKDWVKDLFGTNTKSNATAKNNTLTSIVPSLALPTTNQATPTSTVTSPSQIAASTTSLRGGAIGKGVSSSRNTR